MDDKTERTYLTGEEQGIFREWDLLFQSPGWDRLTKELVAELEAMPTERFINAKDWNEVLEGRARLRVLAEMVNYASIIDQRKQHTIYEREQTAIEAEEDKSSRDL